MRSLRSLALLAICVVPLSCRSNEAREEVVVPCVCGDPVEDMQGCAHPQCLHGERNPANLDCVCGGLSIPK